MLKVKKPTATAAKAPTGEAKRALEMAGVPMNKRRGGGTAQMKTTTVSGKPQGSQPVKKAGKNINTFGVPPAAETHVLQGKLTDSSNQRISKEKKAPPSGKSPSVASVAAHPEWLRSMSVTARTNYFKSHPNSKYKPR